MGDVSGELTAGRLEGFVHLANRHFRIFHRFGGVGS